MNGGDDGDGRSGTEPLLDVAAYPAGEGNDDGGGGGGGGGDAGGCCQSQSHLAKRRASFVPRLILIAVSCVMTTLLSGGVVLGFGSLQEQLLQEGQYDELCTAINASCLSSFARTGACAVNTTADGNCVPGVGGNGTCFLKICGPQQDRLQSMYTLTYAVMNLASAVIGIMVDTVGPRAATLLGLAMSCAGFALLAVSDSTGNDFFVLGFCLIGAGGIGPYFAHFNFSNLFRKYQGVYVSAVTGLFNLSGLNFYWLFTVAGAALRTDMGLTPQELRYQIFFVYACVAGGSTLLVAALYPDRVYHDGDVCVLPVQTLARKCAGGAADAAIADGGEGEGESEGEGEGRGASKSVVVAAQVSLPDAAPAEGGDDGTAAAAVVTPGKGGSGGGSGGGSDDDDDDDDDNDLDDSPRANTTHDDDVYGPNGRPGAEGGKFSSLALIKHSLKRRKFWWLLAWWCVSNLVVAFLGGGFPVLLESLNGTANEVSWQTSILSNLPILFFNPLIGIFLEKHGFSLVFFVGNLVACGCVALLISPVYAVQIGNLVLQSMQKAFLFTVTFAFLLMEFPIEIYGTLAALVTFVAFGVGFLDTPLVALVAYSKELIPSTAVNGGYVLPGAVLLAGLLPCFWLARVTRKVSKRQKRYRLQKRKTTMADLA